MTFKGTQHVYVQKRKKHQLPGGAEPRSRMTAGTTISDLRKLLIWHSLSHNNVVNCGHCRTNNVLRPIWPALHTGGRQSPSDKRQYAIYKSKSESITAADCAYPRYYGALNWLALLRVRITYREIRADFAYARMRTITNIGSRFRHCPRSDN